MSFDFVRFILKLKNASAINKEELEVEYSKVREDMVKFLYNEGFIQSFCFKQSKKDKAKVISITLRSFFGKSLLENVQLISKPSLMKYMRFMDVCDISDRRIVIVFSTDKGFLTTSGCKKKKVGGKLLFIC
jgi:small subunit ribosomal protein S8